MSRSSKVLVLGARGMLGRHVCAVLRGISAAPAEGAAARFGSQAELRQTLKEEAPTTVVNCIGYKGQDPAQHLLVNAGFPRVIAEYCEREEALALQVSTNGVFPAHDQRCWTPEDETDPRTPYELSKSLGEDPRMLVIRASFIGLSPRGDGLFDRMRAGDSFADRRWNGITALSFALHLASIINAWDGVVRRGLEHIHSSSVTSFGEIAKYLHSKSRPGGEREGSKLLGGGTEFQDIRGQLDEYDRWLTAGGESLLGVNPR